MKPFIAVYIVVLTCGLTHSYPGGYGSKRYNRANVVEPLIPIYSQPSQQEQQYFDNTPNANYQPQYLSLPYPQPRVADDYNRNPNPNYYYYPRQEYQQMPLYGIPTYRGDYQPKPYYFAQPSYTSSDDQLEATNPLDYLHEEILQENERERTMNNAQFMQNLALYNKQVDSLHGRQQQLQQFQDLYNLKSSHDPEDYDVEQPTDWYDQTSIYVDPSTYENFNHEYQPASSQQQYPSRPSEYDDEMVKELRDLTKTHRSKNKEKTRDSYMDWQQDLPQENNNDDVMEPQYDDDDDTWINWDQKRSVQPKKDYGAVDAKQTTTGKLPAAAKTSTEAPATSTTAENSKLIGKLHKGQKEVVLPRPATPVRKPFSDSIMKMMNANVKSDVEQKTETTPPIYKTIKQIIDMEQNLSHLSNNEIPTSKIRKRFVTNEEALVQQLNGLKRSSK